MLHARSYAGELDGGRKRIDANIRARASRPSLSARRRGRRSPSKQRVQQRDERRSETAAAA